MTYLDNAATSINTKFHRSDYPAYFNSHTPYAYKSNLALLASENKIKKAIGAKGGRVFFGGTATKLIGWLFDELYVNLFATYFCCDKKEHDAVYMFNDAPCNPTLFGKMLVNNVVGEINDVVTEGKNAHDQRALFLCDMTAGIGKAPIPQGIDDWCDFAMWSTHKIHGEGDAGAIWVSDRARNILAGELEMDGTVDIQAACMTADATVDAIANCEKNEAHYAKLNAAFQEYWCEVFGDCQGYHYIRGEKYSNAINAITLDKVSADALQILLAHRDIYIGRGASACADNNDYRVLNAYGLSNNEAERTIRVSYDESTTVDDIKALVHGIYDFKSKFC